MKTQQISFRKAFGLLLGLFMCYAEASMAQWRSSAGTGGDSPTNSVYALAAGSDSRVFAVDGAINLSSSGNVNPVFGTATVSLDMEGYDENGVYTDKESPNWTYTYIYDGYVYFGSELHGTWRARLSSMDFLSSTIAVDALGLTGLQFVGPKLDPTDRPYRANVEFDGISGKAMLGLNGYIYLAVVSGGLAYGELSEGEFAGQIGCNNQKDCYWKHDNTSLDFTCLTSMVIGSTTYLIGGTVNNAVYYAAIGTNGDPGNWTQIQNNLINAASKKIRDVKVIGQRLFIATENGAYYTDNMTGVSPNAHYFYDIVNAHSGGAAALAVNGNQLYVLSNLFVKLVVDATASSFTVVDFGNAGPTCTINLVGHLALKTQSGDVSLWGGRSNSTTIFRTGLYITPTLNFTFAPTCANCVNSTITLTNTSTGFASFSPTYVWSFTANSSFTPSGSGGTVQFTNSGDKNMTLSVTAIPGYGGPLPTSVVKSVTIGSTTAPSTQTTSLNATFTRTIDNATTPATLCRQQLSATWNRGNGTKTMVLARIGGSPSNPPAGNLGICTSGGTWDYGSGALFNGTDYVIYIGTGTSISVDVPLTNVVSFSGSLANIGVRAIEINEACSFATSSASNTEYQTTLGSPVLQFCAGPRFDSIQEATADEFDFTSFAIGKSLLIQTNNAQVNTEVIEIFDITGRPVYRLENEVVSGEKEIILNQPKGMYLVRIQAEGKMVSKRFMLE